MSENDKRINEQLDKAFRDAKPVSATDCTGLIQGLESDGEADVSAKMYNIALCVNKDGGENLKKESRGQNDRKR